MSDSRQSQIRKQAEPSLQQQMRVADSGETREMDTAAGLPPVVGAQVAPQRLTPANVMALQRAIGNRAVTELLGRERQQSTPRLQPRLNVGPVNDRYEQEADRVATQVVGGMNMAQPEALQRHHQREEDDIQMKPVAQQITPVLQRHATEEEDEIQMKSLAGQPAMAIQRHHAEFEDLLQAKSIIQRHEDEQHGGGCGCDGCRVQRKIEKSGVQRATHGRGCSCADCTGVQMKAAPVSADGSFTAGDDLTRRVNRLQGRGKPLPDTIRREFEPRFGADFSDVRIHTGAEAAMLNRKMAAQAFTHGKNIAFAPHKFDVHSSAGRHLLAHELTHTIQQTGARQLQRNTENHGKGCGCNNCAKVQRRAAMPTGWRHTATARTRAGVVAKENSTSAATVQRISDTPMPMVQRHSSWEHKLIGDLTPQDLAIVGAGRNAQEMASSYGEDVTVDAAGQQVTRENVLHVIEQEIRRLQYFQANPMDAIVDMKDLKLRESYLRVKDMQHRYDKATDSQGRQDALNSPWQVRLVAITASDGRIFGVTYGELNTLGDFYGSVEEMQAGDPDFLERLIRGVRQSTLEQMIDLYAEIKGEKSKKARKSLGIKSTSYKSSSGKDNAVSLGGVMNELKLMGKMPTRQEKQGRRLNQRKTFRRWKHRRDESEGYAATLARNACHFAPESWHAWAINHEKARTAALQAHQLRQGGNNDAADDKMNEALLYNGFGDHYLQDSYAAGHLINKTQIMQYYVQWLDENPWKWDAYSDENWRGMQRMAYAQSGLWDQQMFNKSGIDKSNTNAQKVEARNPQSVANAHNTWESQFDALGLQAPSAMTRGSDAYKLLTWWQMDILNKSRVRKPKEKTYKTMLKDGPLQNPQGFDAALHSMLMQGVVRPKKYSVDYMAKIRNKATAFASLSDVFVLEDAYVATDRTRLQTAMNAGDGGTSYERMGKAAVFGDYRAFMRSSYLQKATNTLHDYYCVNGLNVYAGGGGQVFKIYGDNNMLQKDSAKGLKHSGETARMSQQAIENIATNGNDGGISTNAIATRFPEGVELSPGGQRVSLADWHNQGFLKKKCFSEVFPKMSDFGGSMLKNKLAPGVFGRSLGKVTPSKPHGAEVF